MEFMDRHRCAGHRLGNTDLKNIPVIRFCHVSNIEKKMYLALNIWSVVDVMFQQKQAFESLFACLFAIMPPVLVKILILE
jgi:hypothetical protein